MTNYPNITACSISVHAILAHFPHAIQIRELSLSCSATRCQPVTALFDPSSPHSHRPSTLDLHPPSSPSFGPDVNPACTLYASISIALLSSILLLHHVTSILFGAASIPLPCAPSGDCFCGADAAGVEDGSWRVGAVISSHLSQRGSDCEQSSDMSAWFGFRQVSACGSDDCRNVSAKCQGLA